MLSCPLCPLQLGDPAAMWSHEERDHPVTLPAKPSDPAKLRAVLVALESATQKADGSIVCPVCQTITGTEKSDLQEHLDEGVNDFGRNSAPCCDWSSVLDLEGTAAGEADGEAESDSNDDDIIDEEPADDDDDTSKFQCLWCPKLVTLAAADIVAAPTFAEARTISAAGAHMVQEHGYNFFREVVERLPEDEYQRMRVVNYLRACFRDRRCPHGDACNEGGHVDPKDLPAAGHHPSAMPSTSPKFPTWQAWSEHVVRERHFFPADDRSMPKGDDWLHPVLYVDQRSSAEQREDQNEQEAVRLLGNAAEGIAAFKAPDALLEWVMADGTDEEENIPMVPTLIELKRRHDAAAP